MIAIFLAAFAIPVTFESVMWVVGSGSLANTVSFTPGAVGVTQATNALALKTCCHVPNSQAVDYSTAQQLITTAWNQIVAIVLVCFVFGWTGGKQLVTQSYCGGQDEDRRDERGAPPQAAREEGRQAEGQGGEETEGRRVAARRGRIEISVDLPEDRRSR